MDRGIDGVISFVEGSTDRRRVVVSVKSGNLTPAFVRDLKGVLEREGEPIGVLVTLKQPTREMRTEATAAGSYHSDLWNADYSRIQIITAADLLNGKKANMPPSQASPFAAAPKERIEKGQRGGLTL
jgi:Restriction endonuclease